MSDIDEARNLLNKVIHDVTKIAPSYAAQIEQIENTKLELKKLIDEEQYLKNRIHQEEQISAAFNNLISLQVKGKDENYRRYNESLEFFKTEVMKNAKYSISAKKRPLIFFLKGAGHSPLINSTMKKSLILKKKAEITRKIYHLRQLQQKIFCISEDYINKFPDYNVVFTQFQINTDINYSEFRMENFSNSIKETLKTHETDHIKTPVQNSITNLSNIFSSSTAFLPNNGNNNQQIIPLHTFTFQNSHPINTKEMPNYFDDFNKLISPTLEDIINNIENLLKKMNEIFQLEKSTIATSTEQFFKSNPALVHSASVLCSNIIIKAQEKILEAQKIAYLINQNILPPENKVQNESQHIEFLLHELSSIFYTIYDRLSRNQIISQNISFDFDQTKFESFSLDEISRAQIERCNSIVKEMKKIFEQNLTVNKSFLSILDDILTRTRENQSTRPKFKINLKMSPPTEIDDTDIKEKFLLLKQRILKKQSEQLDSFCNALEELPPEVKQIQIRNDQPETNQPTNPPGLHFPSKSNSDDNQSEIQNNSNYYTDFESKLISIQARSNPYQDSNQNLLEKIMQKEREQPETKTITSTIQTDNDNSPNFDIARKHYAAFENIKSTLSSSIQSDNIDELKAKRENLLNELQQKTEKFKISLNQKNERMKKKLSERDQLKSRSDKRDQLLNELNTGKSELLKLSNDLEAIQSEIDLLENEKNELDLKKAHIDSLQSEYNDNLQLLEEIANQEKEFNRMKNE